MNWWKFELTIQPFLVSLACRFISYWLKVWTFLYTAAYRETKTALQQRFTMRSGILTGNDIGGAAQVAATHCPNERTLDPAGCTTAITDLRYLCPSQPHYGLHPAMFSGNDSLFLVASITRYKLIQLLKLFAAISQYSRLFLFRLFCSLIF